MTTNNPSSPDQPQLLWSARHPKLKRAFKTALVVLIILTAVAFLLPIWVSTPQGLRYALKHVNQRINGNIELESWKLSWFTGMELKGVILRDAENKVILNCDSIQSDLTLWGLLTNNYDVGTMVLNSPKIRLRRYEDGSNDLLRIWYPKPTSTSGTQPAATPYAPNTGPWQLQSLRGVIRVNLGSIWLSINNATPATPPLKLTNVAAEIPIAAASSPIHLTLQAQSVLGDRKELVTLKGDLPAIATWGDNPGAFLRNMQLTAGQIPVATTCQWLGLKGSWDSVLGPTLDSVFIDTHVPVSTSGTTNKPSIAKAQIRSSDAQIDLSILLDTKLVTDSSSPSTTHERLTFTIPNNPDYYASLKVRCGAPILGYLAYINPILRDVDPGLGSVEASVAAGSLSTDQPTLAQANMLVRLNGLQLSKLHAPADKSPHLLDQIIAVGGFPGKIADSSIPQDDNGFPILLTIPDMKITIERGAIRSEPIPILLNQRSRWIFTGAISTTGNIKMLLTLPLEKRTTGNQETLGGATLQLPITGNVDSPKLLVPGNLQDLNPDKPGL